MGGEEKRCGKIIRDKMGGEVQEEEKRCGKIIRDKMGGEEGDDEDEHEHDADFCYTKVTEFRGSRATIGGFFRIIG